MDSNSMATTSYAALVGTLKLCAIAFNAYLGFLLAVKYKKMPSAIVWRYLIGGTILATFVVSCGEVYYSDRRSASDHDTITALVAGNTLFMEQNQQLLVSNSNMVSQISSQKEFLISLQNQSQKLQKNLLEKIGPEAQDDN
jgi:hypothetical protein